MQSKGGAWGGSLAGYPHPEGTRCQAPPTYEKVSRMASATRLSVQQIVIIVLALFIGVLSAVKQYSLLDNAFTSVSFVAYSMPIFLLAFSLIYLLAVKSREAGLPYFPTSGMFDPSEGRTLGQLIWHLVLPVATISLISVAGYSRYIRSTMLEVINSDYIRTARAKGLSERTILYVHGFKNAALPLATLIGLDLPFLLGGAVVTESIFAWPGMGRHARRTPVGLLPARNSPAGRFLAWRCRPQCAACHGRLFGRTTTQ